MRNFKLEDMFRVNQPLIGMLHLQALPGSPHFSGDVREIRDRLMSDAEALLEGGVHGLLLENLAMRLFPRARSRTGRGRRDALACDVRRHCDLPLGINVLRNDGRSALAIAHASGADFIRINVLCGARVTDQGIVQGIAHDLLRERALLAAEQIRIFADVDVKHSAPLTARPIQDEVADMLQRGGADAIIVSGGSTGAAVDLRELKHVQIAAAGAPVFIGSGVNGESIEQLLPYADGFIIGTSVKQEGAVANPVDVSRVAALVRKSN